MRVDITFVNPYGDKIRIAQPSGGDGYFVSCNNYHEGCLMKFKGEWVLHSNTQSLTGEEIREYGRRIDEAKASI